ncbi:MAG: leucyl/phenylalanyl-tRNA--protein transferase [Marinilabiliales bacterium]|nr:MAG: leucyl/phenylalanyl-tRNA--protein transferase [Marinilabiliales bacterium]
MPVFLLDEEDISFPPPGIAKEDGLLAVGGDLKPERLIEAYKNGIFPWYSEGYPIMWWSPDPRMVMFPKDFKKSKSLRRLVEKGEFVVKFDTNFESVINACARVYRANEDGTWIVDDMIEAYTRLYKLGVAHSVETYKDGNLVGGLYGLAIGKVFFGESMFHHVSNASKVAYWHLINRLLEWDFEIIDAQQETEHFKSLGGKTIEREKFLTLLYNSVEKRQDFKNWNINGR